MDQLTMLFVFIAFVAIVYYLCFYSCEAAKPASEIKTGEGEFEEIGGDISEDSRPLN